MTYATATAIRAHATSDIEEVAAVLCRLATLANVGGRLAERDDSVEAAADLLAHLPRLRSSRTPSTTS